MCHVKLFSNPCSYSYMIIRVDSFQKAHLHFRIRTTKCLRNRRRVGTPPPLNIPTLKRMKRVFALAMIRNGIDHIYHGNNKFRNSDTCVFSFVRSFRQPTSQSVRVMAMCISWLVHVVHSFLLFIQGKATYSVTHSLTHSLTRPEQNRGEENRPVV